MILVGIVLDPELSFEEKFHSSTVFKIKSEIWNFSRNKNELHLKSCIISGHWNVNSSLFKYKF